MIDFARKLDELLDVPLVVCAPGTNGAEFAFPTGERDGLTSSDNEAQLARWRPGRAILAVMGGGVAALDVDPRNGGDVGRTRQMLDGLGVRIFAEIATPGGGAHLYVSGHPELASAHNLTGWPGLDVQSFGSLLFLPPTERPKYNGAGYKIIFDNLDALADGGDPDILALADWVAARRGKPEQFEAAPLWNGRQPDRRQAAYLDKMILNTHTELSRMPKDSGRNTGTYTAALKIGNYIAGAGLDEARAVAMLLDACQRNGLISEDGEANVRATIASGLKNGKVRPRAVPEPNDQDHYEPPEGELSLILPVEFYDARPVLTAIRAYAHSRGAAADTVLYATLARVSAMVPHECRLETGIGPPLGASLNLFVAAVGPPGSGKSSGASVAKDLYTSALLDFADGLPLGSGKGVAEAFMGYEERSTGETYKTGESKGEPKKIKVHCQVRHNAFFVADEGEALTKMIERSGATTGAALRSAWYGQTLGQQNADAERRRRVPEGSYSMGMIIGFQPETVLPLLRDGAAGTPQRFVYCHTVDPTKPATRPARGDVYARHLEARAANLIIPEKIADEVWQHHHAYTTGAIMVDRLDAHGYLTRLKLGALLALLEGRRVVSADDWQLTNITWATSCAVRDHYLKLAGIAEARDRHARNLSYADREEMAEVRRQRVRDASTKIVRIARLIAKYVHDPVKPSGTIGDVHRRLKSENRPHLTEALDYAASEGWIEIDGNDIAPGPSQPADSN